MAFAPLPPELRQKALSIASSYKNGGSVASKPVAKFAPGGEVNDYESEAYGVEASDVSGMADLAAEAEAATSGMSDKERDFAAEAAIEDLDRGAGGGSLEERDRAIQSLLDQAAPPDTGDTETGRFGGITPTVENLPAAIEAAKRAGAVKLAAMMENKLNELQGSRPTALEPERETVTQAAVTKPAGIDFLQEEIDRFKDFDPTKGAGIPSLDVTGPRSPREQGEVEKAIRDAEAERQAKVAGISALGAAVGLPFAGVAKDIYKTVADPETKARELLGGRGLGRNQTAERRVDEEGNFVGTVVKEGDVVVSIQPTSFSNAFSDALKDDYTQLNARQQEEREARGGDEPITEEDVAVEEEVEAAPEKPPTIDIVPFRPEDFYYFNPQRRYPYGVPSLMNMRNQ